MSRFRPVTLGEFEWLLEEAQSQHKNKGEPIPKLKEGQLPAIESCLNTPFQTFDRKYLYRGFLNKAGESYKLAVSFDDMVFILNDQAAKDNYSPKVDTVTIELESGVYMRTKLNSLINLVDYMVEEEIEQNIELEDRKFFKLEDGEWKKITQDVHVPDRLFGDESLVKFKVGFKI